MTELGFVEKPMLQWLEGMGWLCRDEKQMDAFGRAITDPIVEALLVPAIRRINPAVTDDAQAQRVVEQFRRVLVLPDPLEANQKTLAALRDGISVVLAPGQDATTVKLIEFDRDKLDRNDFTATNQYRVKGTETCRADTVLLVNGIPVVVAEYKSFVNSGMDWREGGEPTAPLPARSTDPVGPERLLCRRRRTGVPLRPGRLRDQLAEGHRRPA